jgi:4-alpha-glucanotransferase
VAGFSADNPSRVLFHQWLQWLASEQLATVQRRARAAGMRIGLYLDLAVGVAPDGSATWADPDLIVAGARIGAPPDLFNAKGQDWGLAPMSPSILKQRSLEPFAEDVAALMRHAGAIRIDHVMGLERLYWIPEGADARGGGYVNYPLGDLLACLGTLSQKFRTIVVGEDLGTVPAGLREEMREAEIQGYRVLYFERRDDRSFVDPAHYPVHAVACLATHDLPTLKGWWLGRDILARSNIGLYSAEEAARARLERGDDRRRLLSALCAVGLADNDLRRAADNPSPSELPESAGPAVHRYLARTPSRLLAVQLEDLVGVTDQPNLPGTQAEYPNWRQKLPVDLGSIKSISSFQAMTAAVHSERPRSQ